ncbi:MAG: hypothetical protein CMH64_02490 [Nanoarchaeota archaeon]|nr:hypothetical protein [Nanoarchaeota archaeon]
MGRDYNKIQLFEDSGLEDFSYWLRIPSTDTFGHKVSFVNPKWDHGKIMADVELCFQREDGTGADPTLKFPRLTVGCEYPSLGLEEFAEELNSVGGVAKYGRERHPYDGQFLPLVAIRDLFGDGVDHYNQECLRIHQKFFEE